MKDLSEEAKEACLEIYQSWSKKEVQKIGHSVIYAWNLGQHISNQPLSQEDNQPIYWCKKCKVGRSEWFNHCVQCGSDSGCYTKTS